MLESFNKLMQEILQNGWDYSMIVIYLAAVLAIGLYCSRGNKTAEKYLMAGRQLPFFAVGMACVMALLSSVSLVMVPGEIYNNGLTLFLVQNTLVTLLSIPCYLIFTRFYFRLGSFTPYEYLEYRYDKTVRGVIAAAVFYTRTMYLGMVIYTTAKIFEAAYNWPPFFSILLVGVFAVFYTFKGGATAVIWTDVLQFVVLFGTFFAVICILCYKIDGGAVAAITTAFEQGRGAPQFSDPNFYKLTPYLRLLFFLMVWNGIISPLTTACSDQIIIQRLLSTKNWKEGFKAQCVSTGFSAIFTLALWFVGLAVFTYYFQNPDPSIKEGAGDKAFFHFVATELPTPLPGIFIAGMLAAIMSTLSSGLNSMATIWLKEFHVKFINKNLDAAGEVRISKLATLYLGLFVMIFGFLLEYSGNFLKQSVAEVQTLFVIFGTAVLPAFLLAVLSKRANSTLIWAFTVYAFGEKIANNFWYALSRPAVAAWKEDPSVGFGWGGKLAFDWYVYLWIILGTAFAIPYLIKAIRAHWYGKLSGLISCFFFGCSQSILIWYIYSNIYVKDVPLERSFAFFLPIDYILVFIALWFFPVQPKEKYQGLTLSTINEPILQKK